MFLMVFAIWEYHVATDSKRGQLCGGGDVWGFFVVVFYLFGGVGEGAVGVFLEGESVWFFR